jgi:uncharacterized damage-inducible protein DinB
MTTPTKTPRATDPYDILLAHNLWGTRIILDRCDRLTPQQFSTPFPIGPGETSGLRGALTHVISAMGRWADRIAGHALRTPLGPAWPGYQGPVDDRVHTARELRELLEKNHADLAELAPSIRAAPGRLVRVEMGGEAFVFTAAVAYIHVLTHGHYHRAQCLNMLRHLGVAGVSDKLPELDVVDWQHECEA